MLLGFFLLMLMAIQFNRSVANDEKSNLLLEKPNLAKILSILQRIDNEQQKRWFASSRLPGSTSVKLSINDRELEFCAQCLLNYGINYNNECYPCFSKYIISAVDKRNKPASKYWHSRAG